jgi:hypothetical protein
VISRTRRLAVALAAAFSADAGAVYLDPDGLGQALIYPYYTVRSQGTNAFNTYLSVVNTTGDVKVVRVRLREGRNGREALNFNLYLDAYDMWTGALVPGDDGGAALLSTDISCTNPAMTVVTPATQTTMGVNKFVLGNAAFSGASADGRGGELDRVREGYVEMIEMATLTGASAGAARIGSNGVVLNCPLLRGPTVPLTGDLQPPSGGLMGTLTLINVSLGEDFTVNAEALSSLTSQPFYRNYDSAYPDFDAAEVVPVSEVTAGGKRYRLAWTRGVDAVTSVLMQASTTNEYVLDNATASLTEWIVTMPTRRFYRTAISATAPFQFFSAQPDCDEVDWVPYTREERVQSPGCEFFYDLLSCSPLPRLCNAATVWPMANGATHMGPLVGSLNTVRWDTTPMTTNPMPPNLIGTFGNGWMRIEHGSSSPPRLLVSQPASTARDLRTGAVTPGPFRLVGLPVVGFMARTFSNGTLTCAAGACQGNYGSAFPHHADRIIEPVP